MNNLVIGLCAGRHNLPVASNIFPHTIKRADIKRPARLYHTARASLSRALTGDPGDVHLTLYVTGLTIAYQAAINAARDLGIARITAMHYDRDSGNYIRQEVST